MKWDTESFLRAFEDNTLGRKRQQGNYYILEFPDCHIMMYGGGGNQECVAIRLADNLTIFNSRFSSGRGSRYEGKIEYPINSIPIIEDSKLLDSDNRSHLFSLGTTRLLLDYEIGDLGTKKPYSKDREWEVKPKAVTPREFLDKTASESEILTIKEVFSEEVTVERVRRDLVPDEALNTEGSLGYNGIWYIPMPPGFSPPEIDPEVMETLKHPPSPQQFDLPNEILENSSPLVELSVVTQGDFGVEVAVQMEALETEVSKWNRAFKIYSQATSLRTLMNRGFPIIASGEGVLARVLMDGDTNYIKGNIQAKDQGYYRSYGPEHICTATKDATVLTLHNWHKAIKVY